MTAIWTKSTQRVQVIAGRAIILRAAIILQNLWEKYDKWLLFGIVTLLFGSEQMSSLLRESPFSAFLTKQHIKGHTGFSDLPKWNLKFQTMMVRESGAVAVDILNCSRPQVDDSSGDDHVAEVLEITSGSKGSDSSRK